MAELKKCPFCGGEADLIEYIETVDGRGDKISRVRCKCGCEIHLTMREFSQAEDDFGYKGGYYSQNKDFWEGMHQRLVDKWNNRATESEIRAKAEHTYENCHNITCRRKCQKDGYNMAIDEFAEDLIKTFCYDTTENIGMKEKVTFFNSANIRKHILQVAEQLKEES